MKTSVPSSVVLLSGLLLFSLPAMAAEFTVTSPADDGGGGTLRVLVALAAAGDTIHIPGDIGPIQINSVIDFGSKPLIFLGDPANRPILTNDSVASNQLFKINRGNFEYEFRNLVFSNVTYDGNGACIQFEYMPSGALISNCLFIACHANQGAAVFNNHGHNLIRVQDCEFINNSTADGYAYHNWQGGLVMERCTFSGNTSPTRAPAIHLGNGGATMPMCVIDSVFTDNVGVEGGVIQVGHGASNLVERCLFVDNSATTGGAIWARNPYVIRESVFLRNYSKSGGGALWQYGASVEIYDTIFEENWDGGGANWQTGGAVFIRQNPADTYMVSNCVFRANYCLEKDGMDGAVGAFPGDNQVTFIDCLFENNRSRGGSAAVSVKFPTTFHNSVFRDNVCTNEGASAIRIATESPTRLVTIENSSFVRNQSKARGTIWIHTDAGAGARIRDLVNISFCTFVNNTNSHAAVYLNNGPTFDPLEPLTTIKGTVFYGNVDTDGNPKDIHGVVRTANNVVTDQAGTDFYIFDEDSSGPNWFGGVLGNPLFADDLAANETEKILPDGTPLPTLAIMAKSPLRHKGGPYAEVPYDARGFERGVYDNLADVGAYEFQSVLPTLLLLK